MCLIKEDGSTEGSRWHGQLSVECLLGSFIILHSVVHEPLGLSRFAARRNFLLHLRSSDWDAASPPRYVVAIVAVVVPEGLVPPYLWERQGVGGECRIKPAGHSWQRPGGQHGDVGRDQRTFLHITPAELWKLQKILSSKKGKLSHTYKKNAEATTKVYDLNQRTTQAPNNLAIVCEQAGANLEVEISQGDPAQC